MAPSREAERAVGRSTAPDRIALFGVLWGLAAVLHLLAGGASGSTWAGGALAVSAGLAICWPGSVVPLTLLAATGLVVAWHDAPDVADHWLLVAFVDVGILLCVLVAALRRRLTDRVDLAERLFPSARLALLAFLGFAAFAKLNDGYLDRRVSCAVVRFRDATSSLGLEVLRLDGAAWLERAVILGSIAAEVGAPLLLVSRRTRTAGALLAIAYHGLLALDRDQAFWDSSVVVLALVSLFVPAAGPWAAERAGSVRARLALRGPRAPVLWRSILVLLPVALGLLVATDRLGEGTAQDVGWWAWQGCLVAAVVTLVRLARQRRPAPRVRLAPHHLVFAVVPLLVVLNGAAPYLEVKTAGAWTSWSNLRTVGGDNHRLVTATGSLAGSEADVVRIVDTDDPVLAGYRSRAVGLTWRELRRYLSDHPGVAVTYVREGRRVALAAARDRPDLVEPLASWEAKLLPYRPVDLIAPERCLAAAEPGS